MATGILSLAARGEGLMALSDVLLWLAVAVGAALICYHAARYMRSPGRLLEEWRSSAIFNHFTFVAGTALVGHSLLLAGAGRAVGWVLLLAAGAIWVGITVTVVVELEALHTLHPRSEIEGGWLLAIVAPQSLAVLCLTLAEGSRTPHLLQLAALALWLPASALYWPIAAIRVRGLLAYARTGAGEMRPDDWILMGALAVSVLAGSQLFDSLGTGSGVGHTMHWLLLAAVAGQLIAALASLPLLLRDERRRIAVIGVGRGRAAKFGAGRWSTVFPLGMLAAACDAFADAAGFGAPTVVSAVSFGFGLLLWIGAAAAGAYRYGAAAGRSESAS